jgi:hypothetical protein
MDANRFEDLLRSLSKAPSRRGVARALAGVTVAGTLSPWLGFASADAKRNKKKRRRRKKKSHKNQPFCAEKNACTQEAVQCDVEGRPGFEACFCYVRASDGQPVCGRLGSIYDQVPDCALCAADKICVDFDGCGGSFPFFCLTPCPDPR